MRVTRFDRMQREVWEYRRYENPTDERQIAVQFSPDGIVREVLALKDYKPGDTVIKYGVDIGKVVAPIARGEHTHVQNLKTKRW